MCSKSFVLLGHLSDHIVRAHSDRPPSSYVRSDSSNLTFTQPSLSAFRIPSTKRKSSASSDIQRSSTSSDIQRSSTSSDIQRSSTSSDIQRSSTSSDIQRSSTSSDIQRSPTSSDIQRPSTNSCDVPNTYNHHLASRPDRNGGKHGQSTPQNFAAERNFNRNTTESKSICLCCNITYSSVFGLRRHNVNKHIKMGLNVTDMNSSFPCPSCSQVFSKLENLSVHEWATHNRRKLSCGSCLFDSTNLEHFRHHLRRHDYLIHKPRDPVSITPSAPSATPIQEPLQYKCPQCSLTFATVMSLAGHSNVVHKEERSGMENHAYRHLSRFPKKRKR